jgi:OTU domain-containing protein 6
MEQELEKRVEKLQRQLQALPKGEKKKQRRIKAEIDGLEAEIALLKEPRDGDAFDQSALLSAVLDASNEAVTQDVHSAALIEPQVSHAGPRATEKAVSRQKLRAQRKKDASRALQAEADAEAADMADDRSQEEHRLREIIAKEGLQVVDIPPDGHCMFAAISNQLSVRHGENRSIQDLRKMAAAYIRAHEDLAPFLQEDPEAYCAKLETTAAWGGEVELAALASTLGAQIAVWQADRPVHRVGEGRRVCLAFYRHTYALGEHYNSLCDVEEHGDRPRQSAAADDAPCDFS